MTVSTDKKTAWLLKRGEQQPEWTLPQATTVGFMRAKCNGMEGESIIGGIVMMPFGQGTPVHSNTGEHIIVQLEGTVEFRIEGTNFRLEQHDMLFIPADVRYAYFNVGRDLAAFLSVLGKVNQWPPKGTYYD